MNSLVAKQVTYEYRNSVQTVRAVNGVSCDFQQGSVYALVGASGSASSSRFDAVLIFTGKETLDSAGFFSVCLEEPEDGFDLDGGAVVSGGGAVVSGGSVTSTSRNTTTVSGGTVS